MIARIRAAVAALAAWLVKRGMNPGWVETVQAIIIATVAALALGVIIWAAFALTGCAGTSVGVKLEHHSSAEDYYDACEENLLGIDMRFPIDFGNCGSHCPELGLFTGPDIRGGCFGNDWVGEASLRVPVWVKK